MSTQPNNDPLSISVGALRIGLADQKECVTIYVEHDGLNHATTLQLDVLEWIVEKLREARQREQGR